MCSSLLETYWLSICAPLLTPLASFTRFAWTKWRTLDRRTSHQRFQPRWKSELAAAMRCARRDLRITPDSFGAERGGKHCGGAQCGRLRDFRTATRPGLLKRIPAPSLVTTGQLGLGSIAYW